MNTKLIEIAGCFGPQCRQAEGNILWEGEMVFTPQSRMTVLYRNAQFPEFLIGPSGQSAHRHSGFHEALYSLCRQALKSEMHMEKHVTESPILR